MLQEEWQVTVDGVKQEVAKRNEVISSALSQQIESVSTGEDDVTLESSLLLHWDMLTVRIVVFLSETEINDSDFVKGFCVVLVFLSVTDHDVVKLEIVVEEAGVMDQFQRVQKLDSNLEYGLLGEGLCSLEQVVLEGLTELILDNIRPNLSFQFFNLSLNLAGILLLYFLNQILVDWEPFVGDQKLALVVGLGKHVLSLLELGVLVNFGESFEFDIVHGVVLSKFNNDWVFDSIFSI